MITKPMLAGKVSLTEASKIRFPVIATPKLDGIRCLIIGGKAVTRKFLPVPNEHVRKLLESAGLPDNLDGELMAGGRNATFQDVSSAIMSHDGEPKFQFCVFDLVTKDGGGLTEPYFDRIYTLDMWVRRFAPPWVKYVKSQTINTLEELENYEAVAVQFGYEGIMIRDPHGPYKCGRSTFNEGYLLKVKRFVDDEAEIIGFEEAEHNGNQATLDFTGARKRSHAKAGMVGKGTLGAFIVRGLKGRFKGVEFRIGTGIGLNDKLKQEIWDDQDSYIGRVVKYRYQPQGTKDKPRIPSFQGFRHRSDM